MIVSSPGDTKGSIHVDDCPIAWVKTYTAKHMLAGALFGCCFPVAATLIDIPLHGMPLTFGSVIQVQASNPLLWIIDTAPIFLGLFAAIIGRRQDRISCLNEHLRRQVAELDNACRIANTATQAKSRFLANVSHEIRTPINGIIGLAGMMDITELTETQQEYCAIIHSNAEGLVRIVNDILDLSKIEAGDIDLVKSDFNPRVLVTDVVHALTPQATAKSLSIRYTYSPDLPTLLNGDSGRLRQILLNLIGNAVKFSDQGTITVEVACQSESQTGVDLKFSITDTGPGIPKSKLNKLFAAFSQVDDSLSRRHGGAGLGLTISKNFVEMMGGSIGVTTKEGEGSTFWFTASFKGHTESSERLDEAA
jgi:signal transduction histidine kinase